MRVFSRSNHLTVLTKSIQNAITILILTDLKHSIKFTIAFSKSLYFHSHKKCHSLLGISNLNLINMLLEELLLLVSHLLI